MTTPIASPGRAEQPGIAEVAALLADRSRVAVLMALYDGRALPAGRLAAEAGVAASTVSGHLARLTEAGLLRVEVSGRHRYFRLARREVGEVLELLALLGPAPAAPRSMRGAARQRRLRQARSCYDHCAGVLGIGVLRRLVDTGALVRVDGYDGTVRAPGDRLSAPVAAAPYRLGPEAAEVVGEWGVDLAAVEAASRPTLRVCVDWTEQQHHLAGGLGAAVLRGFTDAGWVRRSPRPRELEVTAAGEDALADVLTAAS